MLFQAFSCLITHSTPQDTDVAAHCSKNYSLPHEYLINQRIQTAQRQYFLFLHISTLLYLLSLSLSIKTASQKSWMRYKDKWLVIKSKRCRRFILCVLRGITARKHHWRLQRTSTWYLNVFFPPPPISARL